MVFMVNFVSGLQFFNKVLSERMVHSAKREHLITPTILVCRFTLGRKVDKGRFTLGS